ncbi:acylglycerol kinase family protein [Arthrobacter alpinus]|nr:acylglycerol kinase family protein [Arthrobacter alpinus]
MVVAQLRDAGHHVTVLRRRDYAALKEAVESEIAAGADALVVVGGDGMVHLAANALVHTGIPLGIIPAGTGNDAARGLGLDPTMRAQPWRISSSGASNRRAPWTWAALIERGRNRCGLWAHSRPVSTLWSMSGPTAGAGRAGPCATT